jgi:hypothetical protein
MTWLETIRALWFLILFCRLSLSLSLSLALSLVWIRESDWLCLLISNSSKKTFGIFNWLFRFWIDYHYLAVSTLTQLAKRLPLHSLISYLLFPLLSATLANPFTSSLWPLSTLFACFVTSGRVAFICTLFSPLICSLQVSLLLLSQASSSFSVHEASIRLKSQTLFPSFFPHSTKHTNKTETSTSSSAHSFPTQKCPCNSFTTLVLFQIKATFCIRFPSLIHVQQSNCESWCNVNKPALITPFAFISMLIASLKPFLIIPRPSSDLETQRFLSLATSYPFSLLIISRMSLFQFSFTFVLLRSALLLLLTLNCETWQKIVSTFACSVDERLLKVTTGSQLKFDKKGWRQLRIVRLWLLECISGCAYHSCSDNESLNSTAKSHAMHNNDQPHDHPTSATVHFSSFAVSLSLSLPLSLSLSHSLLTLSCLVFDALYSNLERLFETNKEQPN